MSSGYSQFAKLNLNLHEPTQIMLVNGEDQDKIALEEDVSSESTLFAKQHFQSVGSPQLVFANKIDQDENVYSK